MLRGTTRIEAIETFDCLEVRKFSTYENNSFVGVSGLEHNIHECGV